MAVGFPTKANWAAGDVLTASAQDDLAGTVNLLSNASAASGSQLLSNVAGTSFSYTPVNAAAKNLVINGGMNIWQRGTSISVGAFSYTYTADRWQAFSGSACTVSQESTTLPTGALYALKITGGATTSGYEVWQPIETANAIAFANQTATASFYAIGTAGSTATLTIDYSTSTDVAGSGTWTAISPSSGAITLNASTYTQVKTTVSIPSTAKSLRFRVSTSSLTSGQFVTFGNAQLELGSIPTYFSRAGGTIQGELAACQRYYIKFNGSNLYSGIPAIGYLDTITNATMGCAVPVTMRTTPTSVDFSSLRLNDVASAYTNVSAVTLDSNYNSPAMPYANFTTSGAIAYRWCRLGQNNSSSAYLAFSAEL